MDELFEKLCSDLDAEAERQETVFAVCRAQADAIKVRDLVAVEARTAALDALLREAAHSQAIRPILFHSLARSLSLQSSNVTLSDLVRNAPTPWSERLLHTQSRLKAAIERTRRAVRTNARVLRRSIDFNERLLGVIATGPAVPRGYSENGGAAAAFAPALIDHRG